MNSNTQSRTMPPDHASMRQTEMGETFNRVLFSAVDAMEDAKISYGLIGGIAASGMGRPRSTHDIDIFLRPEDADAALEALAKFGFETEVFDKRWLYKGWKDGMMVDVIFKSSGELYFDSETQAHCKKLMYHGREISMVSPEDLIVIKSAVASEIGPHHWHDALALLSHAAIDYAYLLRRARKAARKVLSLLIYAQANDILVPTPVIAELAQTIFGDAFSVPQKPPHLAHAHQPAQTLGQPVAHAASPAPSQSASPYLLAHLHEAIATDPRTANSHIQINLCDQGRKLSVKGEVASVQQRAAIEEVLRAGSQGLTIENQIRLTDMAPPQVEEVL